ncbi:MAG: site-specific integrase, partial [Pseudomonadota bacterium]
MSQAPAHFSAYLAQLKSQRMLSAHTVAAYERDLVQLANFAADKDLLAISHFDIRKFASRMHARGLGPRSIARTLSAWRGFYDWLSEQVALAANPVDGIKAPKRPKSLPKALSPDDAVRLVAPQAHDSKLSAAALCDQAMFELLYS